MRAGTSARWLFRVPASALGVAMLLAGLSGCGGAAQSAARPVTVKVPASRAVHVTAPAVAASRAVHVTAPAVAAPPASSVDGLTPGAGTHYSASGITAWNDGYWFAVAVEDPAGVKTLSIFRWTGHSWQQQARLPVANRDGSLSSGFLGPSTPITAGSLTGAATPDFLIHSSGADTNWLNVVSRATGQWAAVPFEDSGGPTVGENLVKISGDVITVGYDSCNPNCAEGKVTTVGFRYRDGLFTPVDPPGSCTGEALAQAAHTRYSAQSHGQYAITGYACTGGYAAATATNGNQRWAITFAAASGGWKTLASGNALPATGMPPQIHSALRAKLAADPQNAYYPY